MGETLHIQKEYGYFPQLPVKSRQHLHFASVRATYEGVGDFLEWGRVRLVVRRSLGHVRAFADCRIIFTHHIVVALPVFPLARAAAHCAILADRAEIGVFLGLSKQMSTTEL